MEASKIAALLQLLLWMPGPAFGSSLGGQALESALGPGRKLPVFLSSPSQTAETSQLSPRALWSLQQAPLELPPGPIVRRGDQSTGRAIADRVWADQVFDEALTRLRSESGIRRHQSGRWADLVMRILFSEGEPTHEQTRPRRATSATASPPDDRRVQAVERRRPWFPGADRSHVLPSALRGLDPEGWAETRSKLRPAGRSAKFWEAWEASSL